MGDAFLYGNETLRSFGGRPLSRHGAFGGDIRPGVALAFSATQIVQEFLAAWIVGDISGAVAWFAPEGVYALHISDELLPYGGETVGRDNFAGALRSFRENFDYLLFRPLAMVAEEPIVRPAGAKPAASWHRGCADHL